MSNLVVPNVSKIYLLKRTIGLPVGPPSILKLFKNVVVPSNAITVASFTICDFSGYFDEVLAGAAVLGALDGGNRAVAIWNTITWTKMGAVGNDVRGYWVESGTGELCWYEVFDQPVLMQADGAQCVINPKFTGRSQFVN